MENVGEIEVANAISGSVVTHRATDRHITCFGDSASRALAGCFSYALVKGRSAWLQARDLPSDLQWYQPNSRAPRGCPRRRAGRGGKGTVQRGMSDGGMLAAVRERASGALQPGSRESVELSRE